MEDGHELDVPAYLKLSPEDRKAEWAKWSDTKRSAVAPRLVMPTQTEERSNVDTSEQATPKGNGAAEQADARGNAQLVLEYNQLVKEWNELSDEKGAKKPVSKFRTLEEGEKRLEALASSIRARRDGLKTEARQKGGVKAKEVTKEVTKKAKAKPKAAEEEETESTMPSAAKAVVEKFGAREGSNLAKAIAHLAVAKKPVLKTALAKVVYGSPKKVGPLNGVLTGIGAKIDTHKLPFELERTKEGRDVSYLLKSRSRSRK